MSMKVLVLAVVAWAALAPMAAADQGVVVRKSVTALTASERAELVGALHALKATPSPYDPSLSYYDQFVRWHVSLSECSPADPLLQNTMRGHAGPMFLPWHREFLARLEAAMRAVTGKRIALPYWDWTRPESVAAVFANDFMGGNGDPAQDWAVTTGPFRRGQWTLTLQARGSVYALSKFDHLKRRRRGYALPTAAAVAEALAVDGYDVAPWDDRSDRTRSLRNALEGFTKEPATPIWESGCLPEGWWGTLGRGPGRMHNLVHDWVGGSLDDEDPSGSRVGTMKNVEISPSDPVFFLHHAQIDRLWSKWQETHGEDTYEPAAAVAANSRGDVMRPFENTPADVLDIRRLGYVYDDSAPVSRSPGPEVPAWQLSCRL